MERKSCELHKRRSHMTARGCYQALLIIFLVLAPVQAAIDVLVVRSIHPPALAFLLAGLLLQPASAIGLWCDKTWGALLLIIATALCILTAFGGAIGALIILPLAAVRLYVVRRQRPPHR